MESYSYSDGSGGVIMQKTKAEVGDAIIPNLSGTPTTVTNVPRWVGNGRTIVNNKGNAVKQYEPFFSTHYGFEDESEMLQMGVTPALHYDALGRNIRTDMPDGTFTKVSFTAWDQTSYDQNDTVLDSQWYADRSGSGIYATIPEEVEARDKSVAHANTPSKVYLDTLGRTFMTEVHNGFDTITTDPILYTSSIELDIESNPLSVLDTRSNIVTATLFDIAGNAINQTTMDAGQRWMLNDVTGKPIKSWDGANREFSFEYDVLHRPTQSFIKDGSTVWKNMITDYGEIVGGSIANNLRGKVFRTFDSSGFKAITTYDFKGNALTTEQNLLEDATIIDVDWASSPALSSETFTTTSLYDALNRPIEVTDPLNDVRKYFYGDSGALIQMDIDEAGLSTTTTYIEKIEHNAKGQRESISYGNGTKTKYEYDPFTYRVKRIQTNDNASNTFQDLNYWYDAVGNIVKIKDDSHQTLYYSGSVVDPVLKYTYDPIYRLIQSEGRELIGNVLVSPPTAITDSQFNGNYNDAPWMGDFLTGAGGNVQNYTQEYSYDEVNNMTQLKHIASSQSYTRNLAYTANSNQLQSATVGSSTISYSYDAHGNMTSMPHLSAMDYNRVNHLSHTTQGTSDTYYQYDASGNRTRKYTAKAGGIVEERIYLGECEIFRTFTSSSLTLERTTMHVSDGSGRIAMLEVRTVGSDAAPAVLRRYIYSNHLQTASLELDENRDIISYEEYHAFGTTAYQLTNASINAIAKRYKYSGKEKDEESGLYYHGARYYISWLCRWSQCDPIGIKDGVNIYAYCSNNPVGMYDPSGMAGEDFKPVQGKGPNNELKGVGIKGTKPEKSSPAPSASSQFIEGIKEGVASNLTATKDFITSKEGLATIAGGAALMLAVPVLGQIAAVGFGLFTAYNALETVSNLAQGKYYDAGVGAGNLAGEASIGLVTGAVGALVKGASKLKKLNTVDDIENLEQLDNSKPISNALVELPSSPKNNTSVPSHSSLDKKHWQKTESEKAHQGENRAIFKDGNRVMKKDGVTPTKKRVAGSSNPDNWDGVNKIAYEQKNYTTSLAKGNYSGLIKTLQKQIGDRFINLPAGSRQHIQIDITDFNIPSDKQVLIRLEVLEKFTLDQQKFLNIDFFKRTKF